MPLDIAGAAMLLLGGRALYWPARGRLIIADLHLGKGHAFRQAGIAIPQGTTGDDLRRLSDLLAATQARELWIVGDVLHGPAPPAPWRTAWQAWRQQHRHLAVAVLAGNHDRALAQAELGVTLLGASRVDGPFLFQHMPQAAAPGRPHLIAGHVHPKARLAGVPRSWPAFWLKPGVSILPAYSDFTGGVLVRPEPRDLLVACVEGSVIRVPPRPSA